LSAFSKIAGKTAFAEGASELENQIRISRDEKSFAVKAMPEILTNGLTGMKTELKRDAIPQMRRNGGYDFSGGVFPGKLRRISLRRTLRLLPAERLA